MITYEFPYSGWGGPGDGWEGSVQVDLTDEEAERLKASIESEEYDDLDDDDSLEDIREKVFEAIIDFELSNYEYDYVREFMKEGEEPGDAMRRHLEDCRISIHYPGMEDDDE